MIGNPGKMMTFTRLLLLFLLMHTGMAGAAGLTIPTGSVIGVVIDAESSQEIGLASLYIKELNRSVTAHEDGSFHFFDLPAGEYVIRTFRIGYKDDLIPVQVVAQETTFVRITLINSPMTLEDIVVESEKFDAASALRRTDVEVSGKKLRQNLGMTIAKTIETEPGLAQRTMGPAPARPVLRGLSGDRVLILEDGERTGDLSATSADHAVVIEPVNAERIEVIRGPAALLFGANTIGGVINISRSYTPSTLPHRLSGTASLQGESVNRGYAAGANFTLPVGPFAARIDGSYRNAGDIRAPEQTLLNTGIETKNISGGLSWFDDLGFAGISGSLYDSDYGIPPDPNGGHPKGVDIELARQHFETRAELYPGLSWMYRTDLSYSYKRYEHTEFETNDVVGVRFGVVSHHFNMLTHFNQKGSLTHGEIGLWSEIRDYASAGLNFTPASMEYAYALFLYGEHDLGRLGFSASLRYDHKSVEPGTEKIVDRADFTLHIRKRSFGDLSAGLTAAYDLGGGFSAGTTLMRSYRAPGIEELFSEGPHLAAYAYEVGNSELGKETGFGVELFADYADTRGNIHIALFRNRFDGYIFPENTGRQSLRRADLMLYQYAGEDALMIGFEATFDYHLTRIWSVLGTVSYVKGDLTGRKAVLPYMPPLNGRAGLRFEQGSLMLEGGIRFADRQDRLGQFETPTDGYLVLDFSAQYFFQAWHLLHTVTFAVENAGNTVYRQHLNRVKDSMPEPGRNAKLLYRIFF